MGIETDENTPFESRFPRPKPRAPSEAPCVSANTNRNCTWPWSSRRMSAATRIINIAPAIMLRKTSKTRLISLLVRWFVQRCRRRSIIRFSPIVVGCSRSLVVVEGTFVMVWYFCTFVNGRTPYRASFYLLKRRFESVFSLLVISFVSP